jgi:hypothetical protein
MIPCTGRSCFMPGLCSWKTLCKSKLSKLSTKFPFKTVYFLGGVSRLTTSSYTVYAYNTSGHTNLYSTFVLYIQYIYISIQYTHISMQYIYLFVL